MTTARERLTLALVQLAATGGRPPCGEYGGHVLWTSEDADDRAVAVQRCQDCPVLAECHQAAEEADERWHVWGGLDRTPPKRRPGRPAKTIIKET